MLSGIWPRNYPQYDWLFCLGGLAFITHQTLVEVPPRTLFASLPAARNRQGDIGV
jgi:hypothetical protein